MTARLMDKLSGCATLASSGPTEDSREATRSEPELVSGLSMTCTMHGELTTGPKTETIRLGEVLCTSVLPDVPPAVAGNTPGKEV